MKSEIYSEKPNFSIVLPGPCQASCKFCFWKEKKQKDLDGWIKGLYYILNTLPDCFDQVSITGGEPTLSPVFEAVLAGIFLRRDKWKKVVLTTNGVGILQPHNLIHTIKNTNYIDYINISRHHWQDEKNREIFGTQNVPSIKDIAEIAGILKNKLTLNCVYKDMIGKFFDDYLSAARSAGVSNVCFRREHGNLEMCDMEAFLERYFTKLGESRCPVCRSAFYKNGDMTIGFKYSLIESKEVIDGIYELIYHQDGKLTADWEGLEEVDLQEEVCEEAIS